MLSAPTTEPSRCAMTSTVRPSMAATARPGSAPRSRGRRTRSLRRGPGSGCRRAARGRCCCVAPPRRRSARPRPRRRRNRWAGPGLVVDARGLGRGVDLFAVASARPSRMFSAMPMPSSCTSCIRSRPVGTAPQDRRRARRPHRCGPLRPPRHGSVGPGSPSSTCRLPEGPTNAVIEPDGSVTETSCSTSCSPS